MRGFSGFLCTLASMVLIVCVFFSSVQITVLDRNFFDSEYRRLDTSKQVKIAHSDLMEITDVLLGYIANDNDNLRIKSKVNGKEQYVFNEREREHMIDVKNLYLIWESFRNIAAVAVAFVFLLCAVLVRKERLRLFAKCYCIGAMMIGVVVLGLGVWMTIDFNSFWNAFHMLFFTNDLWQLDPNNSVMINMFPLQFWLDICTRILGIFGGVCSGLLLLCGAYLGVRAYRRKTLLAVSDGDMGKGAR